MAGLEVPLSTSRAPRGTGADGPAAGFGLYLHWPFCAAKCPYCDFNSHVARRVDHRRWSAAFAREFARLGAVTPGRTLTSVFFGGGTPSLMPPEFVDALLADMRRVWGWSGDIEVTLEANPSSVERGRFREFALAGVNRFSIGVQALNDVDLKRLGRLHSAREALGAVATARELSGRVSFDLIYARQDQTSAAWRAELAEALALAPEHLSLYQLSIENGTVFGSLHRAGKLRGLPGQDLSAELFEITQELCDAAGLPAYEISNHARSGCEGRHNLVYWRGGDYLGIGPGAHGRLTLAGVRRATSCEPMPEAWLTGVEEGRGGHETVETLTPQDQGAEYLMMSLRLREGASLARFGELSNDALPPSRLDWLRNSGLLWARGDRIGTTGRGRLLLDAILRELL